MRAGIRQEAVPSMPEGLGGAAGRYNDGSGRSAVGAQQIGAGRRGAVTESASAGEELVAKAPIGPTGLPLQDLLKEDFVADACELSCAVLFT